MLIGSYSAKGDPIFTGALLLLESSVFKDILLFRRSKWPAKMITSTTNINTMLVESFSGRVLKERVNVLEENV